MYMLGAEGPREARGEAPGVRATRHHHHPRRSDVHQTAPSNGLGEIGQGLLSTHARDLRTASGASRHTPSNYPDVSSSVAASGSRVRATKSSTGFGNPFSSTAPIGSNSK